jgi:hypothetical protein
MRRKMNTDLPAPVPPLAGPRVPSPLTFGELGRGSSGGRLGLETGPAGRDAENTEDHRKVNGFSGKSKSMNKVQIITQETDVRMG